jgi:6-phosphogluconolactonase
MRVKASTDKEMSNYTSTRREFMRVAGLGAAGLTLSGAAKTDARPSDLRELLVYVGTYTSGRSEGIYLYRLDLKSGALKHAGTTAGVSNPSYLALERRRRLLFAVNELEEFEGRRSGALSAFAIERGTGALRLINQRPTLGGAPCYVTTADSGRFVLVANYSGGSVCVLPVLKDGSLGEAVDLKQDTGPSGVNRERQEAPHAHCIVLDRADRFAYSCDLGTDKIMSYRFDPRTGKLTPNSQPFVETKPGAGPRHFVFHPGGRLAYVLNELDSTVTAYAYDAAHGTLKEVQTTSVLPTDFKGANTAADIHVAPDGRFLYCSNRGHDSIAAFRLDAKTGRLRLFGHTPTGGKTPRNFAIDPSGRFLLVANQNSDSIVTFRLDPQTGALTPTGQTVEVPTPVCLKLAAPFA